MIPYSDGIPARRFPVVNVALIIVNFAGRAFSAVIAWGPM